LRFVIAHLHHGKQLRRARALADRIESDNNMSVEAHIENQLKFGYSKDQFEGMVKKVKAVPLSKAFYDPNALDSDESGDMVEAEIAEADLVDAEAIRNTRFEDEQEYDDEGVDGDE
jgi:hypothetical protein